MSVRPNGLGAARSGWADELDEATAARHSGFFDLALEDAGVAVPPTSAVAATKSFAQLSADELVAEAARAAAPLDDVDDEMESITKWTLVIGTLVAAITLLVGLAAFGAIPFR